MYRQRYRVSRTGGPDPWAQAEQGRVQSYHARGSDHRPEVRFRLAWDNEALHVRFDVADRYVRCVNLAPQSMVCLDSCVELFLQPANAGYLNFEMNAVGTLLCHHITDATRTPNGFASSRPLTATELGQVSIRTSLSGRIDPETAQPLDWWLEARVPFALMAIAGGKVPAAGDIWRANVYKCADQTSHPHWGMWSPIVGNLNFHVPEQFGELEFA